MSGWLSESQAESQPESQAAAQASAGLDATGIDPRHDQRLRVFDVVLALLALLLASPVLVLAWRVGRVERRLCIGRQGRRFERLSLSLPASGPGRVLQACGASAWPVLLNILRGEMAWVGPQPQEPRATQPASLVSHALPLLPVRPGLVNTWFIRRRTAVDFGSEAQADAAYLRQRSLRHDVGVLLRAVLAACLPAPARAMPGEVLLCDVPFHNVNMHEALARLRDMLDGHTPQQVCFVNPACVNIAASHRGYRRTLHRAGLVLPDGIGTKIASDILGTPLKQNVNGTDLFPRLCDMLAARQTRVFLLGGRPEVVARVAEVMHQRWPGLRVVGWRDGYFSVTQEGEVAEQVSASGAEFLLVARGVPAQELFVDRHLDMLGVKVAMSVGGLFDFVSGRISRAPVWMREIGLEWVWRLLQEPRRMWRRYLVGNFAFLGRVVLQRTGWRQPAADVRVQRESDLGAPPPAPPESGVHAVLLATTRADYRMPVREDCPAGLLPMGHVTLLERQIDALAQAAVTSIHLVVCDRPAELRRLLGEGQRWGVQLHWHVMGQPEQALSVLRRPELRGARRVLLGQVGCWLPVEALIQLANAAGVMQAGASASLCQATSPGAPDPASTRWAGWASLEPQHLETLLRLEATGFGPEQLETWLPDTGLNRWVLPEQACVLTQDPVGALEAQQRLLARQLAQPWPAGWQSRPWGAMSPQARVHPRARIQGPVMIGPGCVVEDGAEIGANTVLSRNVVVVRGARVRGCLVWPGTLIGPGVVLEDCIVNGARLFALDPGRVRGLEVPGALGTLDPANVPRLYGRLLAAALWLLPALLLLPWRLLALLGVGRQALDRSPVRGVMLKLEAIALGRLHWFGVRPRGPAEWQALHSEWRALLEVTPVGWLNEPAWLDADADPVQSEAAADAYYAVHAGWREHLRILRGYLRHPGRALG